MRRLVIALFLAIAPLSAAQAGTWAWGCQGQLGEQQVVFNRYLFGILNSKAKFGALDRLTRTEIDPLLKDAVALYDPQNVNEGFGEKTIEFTAKDDAKLKIVLTEKSSRRLSHRHKNIGGRDEDVDTFRKVFSFKRADEAPRDITMQCIEYQLSTCGGRCNRD